MGMRPKTNSVFGQSYYRIKLIALSFCLMLIALFPMQIAAGSGARSKTNVMLHQNLLSGGNVSIQELINNASIGATIVVQAGTYTENVVVNKSVTLIGENIATTTIQGLGVGFTLDLTASNVTIVGLRIRNAGTAIRAINTKGHNVSSNIIEDHGNGIYLENSSNNLIECNNFTRNSYGIVIRNSAFDSLIGNRLEGYSQGISFYDCSDEEVIGNFMLNNYAFQVYLENSQRINLVRNDLVGGCQGIQILRSRYISIIESNVTGTGPYGITLEDSTNCTVRNTILTDNELAFQVLRSSNNLIIDNQLVNNKFGILLLLSVNNTLERNLLAANWWSFGTYGEELLHYINYVDTTNLIDARPVYYLVNSHGVEVPTDAGYVGLVNSTNVNVQDLNLTNGYQGIMLAFSEKNTIHNVSISHAYQGALIFNAHNNTITDCTFKYDEKAIMLSRSNGNKVYNNNFFGKYLVNSNGSLNDWDGGSEIGGNYWSDHSGFDLDCDGIADNPILLDGMEVDRYPLMGSFRAFIEQGLEVDTVSNSTIASFEYDAENRTIGMRLTNLTDEQTAGFCRVIIPHRLMNVSGVSVQINDSVLSSENHTLYDNGTHRWIYFSYSSPDASVTIIPELNSFIIFACLILSVVIGLTLKRKSAHSPY